VSYTGTETAPVGAVWLAVDTIVALEEAKALLKASGGTAHTKGKVSLIDMSVGKPRKSKQAKKVKLDKISSANLFYDPTDSVVNVFSSPPSMPGGKCRWSPRTVWTPTPL